MMRVPPDPLPEQAASSSMVNGAKGRMGAQRSEKADGHARYGLLSLLERKALRSWGGSRPDEMERVPLQRVKAISQLAVFPRSSFTSSLNSLRPAPEEWLSKVCAKVLVLGSYSNRIHLPSNVPR